MKKDVREVIQGEEPHLNNLLTQEDLSSFKGMVDELRDTWTKKQMFRTETEARFSVLQDNRYPTRAAKYWQCVREQSSYLDNLMTLSFDYRRNDAKIKYLEKKISNEKDGYKLTKYEIDLDECRFGKASMEKQARHRMREIKMWSKLKKEFNDGSFNDKDVNQHQLESYGMQYHEKYRALYTFAGAGYDDYKVKTLKNTYFTERRNHMWHWKRDACPNNCTGRGVCRFGYCTYLSHTNI